jgi:hypothetical protein
MSTCPACQREYRSGTIAILLDSNGQPTNKRVCQKCASGGLLIVATKVPAPVQEKVVRAPAFDNIITQLRVMSRAARVSEQRAEFDGGSPDPYFQGRAEGLEAALELVKRVSGQ